MSSNFLVVDPEEGLDVLKGLASSVRVRILRLLHENGPMNVNTVTEHLGLPQSTISSNMQILEEVGLVLTESQKARKGSQKICRAAFDEILVMFKALRHHGMGQRGRNRKLDLAWRLRRQARRLHAALVEAGRLAIWQAEILAGHTGGDICRRGESFLRDDRRSRHRT
jgi:DNA-binding transcriptional ArsR family regulator